MIKLLEEIKHSLLHLVYPSSCLHCQELVPPATPLLCPPCASLLELLVVEERCPICFNVKAEILSHCPFCAKHPSLFLRTAAAFNYLGPAASIIKKMKYGCQPHLAKGAAAFLIAQFVELDWPIPDAIVPVPISFSHWLSRGFNQSTLLAMELSKALQVPVWEALKRSGCSVSQAGLTLEQRRLLGDKQFQLKKSFAIEDKKILVIDDVMTTGTTLNRCAEALYEKCPAALYALTFCKTDTH
jgi:ComF family protein